MGGALPKYDKVKKKQKRSLKKPKHAKCYVFAETTHVVVAPRSFDLVNIGLF